MAVQISTADAGLGTLVGIVGWSKVSGVYAQLVARTRRIAKPQATAVAPVGRQWRHGR